jgi:hypothetical protein
MVRAIAPFYRLGVPIRWMLSATSAAGVPSLVDPTRGGPEGAAGEGPDGPTGDVLEVTSCDAPAAIGNLRR